MTLHSRVAVIASLFLAAACSSAPTTSPSPATPSAAPAETIVVSPTPSPSPTPTATPTEAPSPSATPYPGPELTFHGLGLDAESDPDGHPRAVEFTSEGPVQVIVSVKVVAGSGKAKLCLQPEPAEPYCKTYSQGLITGQPGGKANLGWIVTVVGESSATPTVDLSIAFPSTQPQISISGFHFDGTDAPAYNGIDLTFVPDMDGMLSVDAAWGGHPFVYEVRVMDETAGTVNDQVGQPATGVTQAYPVSAGHTIRLKLWNTESGFGPTALGGVLSWP